MLTPKQLTMCIRKGPRQEGRALNEVPKEFRGTTSEALRLFLLQCTRMPILLAAATLLVHPYYVACSVWLREVHGFNDAALFVFWTFFCRVIPYVVINGFFHALDTNGWLAQYKLPRRKSMVNPPGLLAKTLRLAAVAQLSTVVWVYFLYDTADLTKSIFLPGFDGALPSFVTMAGTYCAATLANTVGFYFTHKWLHYASLYRFHKQHHQFVASVGIAAEYAGLLEMAFGNLLPTVAGVLLSRPHPILFHMWIVIRLAFTYESHSGYSFYNTLPHKLGLTHASAAIFHDFHHTVNSGNFATQWIDSMLGTMAAFEKQGGYEGYLAKKAEWAEQGETPDFAKQH